MNERLRLRRLKLRLTLLDVYRETGIRDARLSLFERRKISLRADEIDRLKRFLYGENRNSPKAQEA